MPINAVAVKQITINSRTYSIQGNVASDVAPQVDVSLAAAKTGTLTTRTDATTGTLTMSSGHGITTGARLDFYWDISGVKGKRIGVTVGTVSTNSVPFSGGAGDDLPVNNSAITAQVPDQENITLTGSNVVLITFQLPAPTGERATVVLASAGADELQINLDETTDTYIWSTQDGSSNPISGDTITKVFLSHARSDAACNVRGQIGYN